MMSEIFNHMYMYDRICSLERHFAYQTLRGLLCPPRGPPPSPPHTPPHILQIVMDSFPSPADK